MKLNLRALLINKIVTTVEFGLALVAILVPSKKFKIAVASLIGIEVAWGPVSLLLFRKGLKEVTEQFNCSKEDALDADLLTGEFDDLLKR